ncbi:hypothetical protein ACEPPN_019392 [Leptodophora sp. 'Broadleaf-Isolate-01']
MERFLVRIQSWSGEGPYWLVNESECGPTSGAMKQSSSEHGKLEMDEQMDEQANTKAEDSSVYQVGIVDDFIDVDGCDWVLVELTDRRSKSRRYFCGIQIPSKTTASCCPPVAGEMQYLHHDSKVLPLNIAQSHQQGQKEENISRKGWHLDDTYMKWKAVYSDGTHKPRFSMLNAVHNLHMAVEILLVFENKPLRITSWMIEFNMIHRLYRAAERIHPCFVAP